MKIITKNLEEKMNSLYKKGSGTTKISKKLKIGKTTVRSHLLKMNTKFRKAPKDKISTSLHERFVNLYKKELSVKQIAQKCNVSFSTVLRHLKKEGINLKERGNPKKIRNPQYYKLTPEKAYILGVIGPGDGFIEYRDKWGIYRIVLEAADKDFIDYFVFCLKKVYCIEPRIEKIKKRGENERPRLKAILQSKEVCNDILQYNCDFREKTWGVPKIIKNSQKNIIIKYSQGFADSQGCVSIRSVILCNRNKDGLKEIADLLYNIGIPDVKQGKIGIILCNRKSVELFFKLISFNILRKKEKLKDVVNNYKIWKSLHEDIIKLKPRIIKLRRQGFSYPKIAKLCNISIRTAWDYSKHLKINRVNQYK